MAGRGGGWGWGSAGGGGGLCRGRGVSLKTRGTGLGAADFFGGNHTSRLSLLDPYHLLSFYKERELGGGGAGEGGGRQGGNGGGGSLETCSTGLGAADFFGGNHTFRLSLLDPYHLLSFYKKREMGGAGGGGGAGEGGGRQGGNGGGVVWRLVVQDVEPLISSVAITPPDCLSFNLTISCHCTQGAGTGRGGGGWEWGGGGGGGGGGGLDGKAEGKTRKAFFFSVSACLLPVHAENCSPSQGTVAHSSLWRGTGWSR